MCYQTSAIVRLRLIRCGYDPVILNVNTHRILAPLLYYSPEVRPNIKTLFYVYPLMIWTLLVREAILRANLQKISVI